MDIDEDGNPKDKSIEEDEIDSINELLSVKPDTFVEGSDNLVEDKKAEDASFDIQIIQRTKETMHGLEGEIKDIFRKQMDAGNTVTAKEPKTVTAKKESFQDDGIQKQLKKKRNNTNKNQSHNSGTKIPISDHQQAWEGTKTTSAEAEAFSADKSGEEIGLALAGGVIRAASSSMGVLRGFTQKKITNADGEKVPAMNMIRYNSGISGGAIPAVLYTYAQVPTDQLLDTNRSHKPSKITLQALEDMPRTSMGYTLAKRPWLILRIIAFAFKTLIRITNIFRPHSAFAAIIYEKTLKPLYVPRNKYFTSGVAELEKILLENPRLRRDQFLLPRDDVKTMPMLLFTMIGNRGDLDFMKKYEGLHEEVWKKYHAQQTLSLMTFKTPSDFHNTSNMTELVLSHLEKYDGNVPIPFVGTPSSVQAGYKGRVQLRHEDVDFPLEPAVPFRWGDKGCFGRKRFSIELLMSMSTNFLGMEASRGSQLLSNIRTIKLKDDGLKMSHQFADGGMSDLMGIVPLIQNKVKNIISVFDYNKNPGYFGINDSYADIYKCASATSITDPDFDAQFHRWIKRWTSGFTCLFGYFGTERMPDKGRILNHVIDDPNLDRLKELMVKMNSLFKAGEPLVVTLKGLRICDNPFWGISAGDMPSMDLTMMYFNMPKKFSKRVPIEAVPPPPGMPKIDKDGRFNNEEMRNVPELPNDLLDYFTYSNKQINMMGYLGSWMVHHSWYGLKGYDGEVVFEGFAEMFDGVPEVKGFKSNKDQIDLSGYV